MDIFVISPASPKPLWLLGIVCILLATILAALVYTAYSSRYSRIEVDSNRIKLVGDFWGREIPLHRLNISDARILDLDATPEYAPKRRTLGTGLPGYASGWFRLRNGEKALVYLTRRHDVVYLPTSDNYSLLLSVEKPESFINKLQQYNP